MDKRKLSETDIISKFILLAFKTVNQTHIGSLLVTVPLLEELKRIVTKVDELMALCDQLKARLTDAQTTKLHLTDAIIAKAL
ncbi:MULTISPECIES: hypothetical protein [Pseudoalteromonas]|jgi:type I restriction enzyme S subunit|uniref:hypothetical protein n=1 Tax=Pseudoalteromonas TaxID=53246 RepID=UPI0003F5698A